MTYRQHKIGLSTFGLIMLNIAAIMSLRGLPIMAETGLTMIFYLLFSVVLFLIPCSLVSAELATGWPGPGGVYRWVKEAFGPRAGFIAIWLQWVQNIFWYPTVITFAASSLAYLFLKPDLASNNDFTAIVILVIYWGATLITFRGLKLAGTVTTLGVLFGTFIPVLLLLGLGAAYCFSGQPIYFMTGHAHVLPNFEHFRNIAFLASIVLLFGGMEVGAVHVHELNKPKKQFPKAAFMSAIAIIVVFTLGSLAIAAVIPNDKINVTAGVMQAFDILLNEHHLGWLSPVLGALLAFGIVASVLAWICGPSKGLLATAKNGEIPPFLATTNKHHIQTHLLLIQALIVTILACLYFVIKDVTVVFFLLSAMTVSLYLVMYLLMFAAAIRLRYSQPDVERAYKIPGGKFGIWCVAGVGFLAVLFAFGMAFVPPGTLAIGTPTLYVGMVAAGLIVFLGLALLIHCFKKKSWMQHPNIEIE